MFVTLRCSECGKAECPYAREYIPEESEEGCTREVSEEVAERFYHDMTEVLPFMAMRGRTDSTDKTYESIEKNLGSIYASPVGRLIGPRGKVDPSKEQRLLARQGG